MLALIKRVLLVVIGFLLIAVFVWFAGPLLGIGDYRPFASVVARLALIVAIVGAWLLVQLLRRLRARRASNQLLASVAAQPQPPHESAEALKLRERFDEAVAVLKQRRSGHSLYDLPWYVIIGAPGSGKTTALLNSGLQFPLEQRVGKGALRGVGGTRNCDWWFTDEAVFLDTAGRYTTQDSDPSSDGVGWREFLALLRIHRARRPLNGVILTINAQELMVHGRAAREVHVEAARRRLNELNEQLHIQLPVYLMVTKCDLVAGFTEYFEGLTAENRSQVWGVTFPYADSLSNAAPLGFPDEFDGLMARLNEQVFARVEDARDPLRRTRSFAFPQQMAALKDALREFVDDVFTSRQFERQVLLRGVYFTSGTQDGTSIDRLLGNIGRRFGVAADAVAPVSGPGKAYFVQRLLKEVIIAESGLAGVNRRVEARKAIGQLAAYAAMAGVAAAGVSVLSLSYTRNKSYLSQAAREVAVLDDLPLVGGSAPIESVLPRLNALRVVVDSSDRYRADNTWALRWGLYQGASIGNAARDAYRRELDGMLLPRLTNVVRTRLVEHAADPDTLLTYFKAYMMLGKPEHLDKMHVQRLAELEWRQRAAMPAEAGTQLLTHLQSLLDDEAPLRPMPLDGVLVTQARNSLKQASLPLIMYGRLKSGYADDRTRQIHLDAVAGLGVEQVLRRKSGVSLAEPVQSVYGRVVFKEITGLERLGFAKQFAEDSWLWGDEDIVSPADAVTLMNAVIALYEQDYIRAWEEILNDLQFVTLSTVAQADAALRILTSQNSPLRNLLKAVRDNTDLIDPPKAAEPAGILASAQKKITEGIGSAIKPAQQAMGVSSVTSGALVTAHFQPLHRLLAGESGKTPLDGILGVIAQIQQQFATLGPDVAGADPSEVLASPTLRGLFQKLKQDAAALPPSLRDLFGEIATNPERGLIREATDDLEQRYAREVVEECRAAVDNHYPFTSGSQTDISLEAFGRLFGYDGVYDKFFSSSLAKQVDTSTTPWTWRPGSVNLSTALLEQFYAVEQLRAIFFERGAKIPAMTFEVTLTNLDRASDRAVLQVNGQRSEATKAPPLRTPMQWPGSSPTGEAYVTFTGRYSPERSFVYGGPWAWFRMIDAHRRGNAAGQPRVLLSLQNSNNHSVDATVDVSNARTNPFTQASWRQFRCEP